MAKVLVDSLACSALVLKPEIAQPLGYKLFFFYYNAIFSELFENEFV